MAPAVSTGRKREKIALAMGEQQRNGDGASSRRWRKRCARTPTMSATNSPRRRARSISAKPIRAASMARRRSDEAREPCRGRRRVHADPGLPRRPQLSGQFPKAPLAPAILSHAAAGSRMKSLWDSALGLLVVTGGLLGLTLPFGKIATGAAFRRSCGRSSFRSAPAAFFWSCLLLRGHRFRLTGAQAALFRHRRGDLLCHPQPVDVFGHPASRRRLHRHHVHAVAGHHAGAVDPARRAPPEPARRGRHRRRLRRRGDGGGDARRSRPAGRAVLGGRLGC